MNENPKIDNTEKNYGLSYAENLILEIQKPKYKPSMKNNIKNLSKNISNNYLLNFSSSDNYSLYKDPKVRIKTYLNLNRKYALY